MKKFILWLLFAVVSPAFAEVSVISVTDENKHTKKEDFSHTFEYYIIPASNPARGGKCQATRIGRRWFATAAHCVTPLCDNGCRIELDLLEQPVSARAAAEHSAKQPAVFIHPDYAGRLAQNDFALFRLDLDRTPLVYYRRGKVNAAVSAQVFKSFLNKNRRAASQLKHIQSPEFPPLVRFDGGNYILDRKISVISIFGGKREIKANPHPVHYVSALGYAYTTNFGIIQGMSGSGVVTNTGELLGMISGNLTATHRSAAKTQTEEFFMFPVFNANIAAFMESVMGSDFYKLEWKDAYPYLVRKSRKNYRAIIESARSAAKP